MTTSSSPILRTFGFTAEHTPQLSRSTSFSNSPPGTASSSLLLQDPTLTDHAIDPSHDMQIQASTGGLKGSDQQFPSLTAPFWQSMPSTTDNNNPPQTPYYATPLDQSQFPNYLTQQSDLSYSTIDTSNIQVQPNTNSAQQPFLRMHMSQDSWQPSSAAPVSSSTLPVIPPPKFNTIPRSSFDTERMPINATFGCKPDEQWYPISTQDTFANPSAQTIEPVAVVSNQGLHATAHQLPQNSTHVTKPMAINRPIFRPSLHRYPSEPAISGSVKPVQSGYPKRHIHPSPDQPFLPLRRYHAEATPSQALTHDRDRSFSNRPTPRFKPTQEQVDILIRAYKENQTPDTVTRQRLAEQLGIEKRTVSIWFQNRRSKSRAKERAANASSNTDCGGLHLSNAVKLGNTPHEAQSITAALRRMTQDDDPSLVILPISELYITDWRRELKRGTAHTDPDLGAALSLSSSPPLLYVYMVHEKQTYRITTPLTTSVISNIQVLSHSQQDSGPGSIAFTLSPNTARYDISRANPDGISTGWIQIDDFSSGRVSGGGLCVINGDTDVLKKMFDTMTSLLQTTQDVPNSPYISSTQLAVQQQMGGSQCGLQGPLNTSLNPDVPSVPVPQSASNASQSSAFQPSSQVASYETQRGQSATNESMVLPHDYTVDSTEVSSDNYPEEAEVTTAIEHFSKLSGTVNPLALKSARLPAELPKAYKEVHTEHGMHLPQPQNPKAATVVEPKMPNLHSLREINYEDILQSQGMLDIEEVVGPTEDEAVQQIGEQDEDRKSSVFDSEASTSDSPLSLFSFRSDV